MPTSATSRPPRPLALVAALCLACLPCLAACAEEPPAICATYVACFFPEEGEAPDAGPAADAELMRATYGSDGDCWRKGSLDPLWGACEQTCERVLRQECRAGEQGLCIDDASGARVLSPPGRKDLELACGALPEDDAAP